VAHGTVCNRRFTLAAALIVAQYAVVYRRVLDYLVTARGQDDQITRCFRYVGLPFGVLLLDVLLLAEPLGLLTRLPLPDWLRDFLPAYTTLRDGSHPMGPQQVHTLWVALPDWLRDFLPAYTTRRLTTHGTPARPHPMGRAA
jgi:hypothetical protein